MRGPVGMARSFAHFEWKRRKLRKRRAHHMNKKYKDMSIEAHLKKNDMTIRNMRNRNGINLTRLQSS